MGFLFGWNVSEYTKAAKKRDYQLPSCQVSCFLAGIVIVDLRNYDTESQLFGRPIDTVHGLMGFMVKLSNEENFFLKKIPWSTLKIFCG